MNPAPIHLSEIPQYLDHSSPMIAIAGEKVFVQRLIG